MDGRAAMKRRAVGTAYSAPESVEEPTTRSPRKKPVFCKDLKSRTIYLLWRILAMVYLLLYTLSGLLVNVLQICIAPLLLVSRPLVIRLNSPLAAYAWGMLQFHFVHLNHGTIRMTGIEKLPPFESAMLISNHVSFLDFVALHAVAASRGMLSRCRYFAKDSLKHMPVFGWGMYLMGMLFVRRNWLHDGKRIKDTFRIYTENKIPVIVVSYVEGTRRSARKLRESHEYARSNGLPVLNNVLLPRSKGFVASVQALRHSHVRALYDVTLAFAHRSRGFDVVPTFWDFSLFGLDDFELILHVDRHVMEDLPEDDATLTSWLYGLFVRKDQRLAAWRAEYESDLARTD